MERGRIYFLNNKSAPIFIDLLANHQIFRKKSTLANYKYLCLDCRLIFALEIGLLVII